MANELFENLRIFDACMTEHELGRGSYASVCIVKWRGALCAGKKVHRVLLESVVGGTANRVAEGFIRECQTWSTLRHPNIAQFLGVHYEPDCNIPVIVMEKMDISLRGVLEERSRQRFPLRHKVNILHQVSLGLLYLHCHRNQLVHRDLTANNVLLNLTSMTAKISDFGVAKCMSEANVSGQMLTEVPGVIAYMPPEAFQSSPHYSAELDVFSYGVLVIHTIVHLWPEPLHATRYEAGQLVALTEFQRRESHVALFTPDERKLLRPLVELCLENDPARRPLTSNIVEHFETMVANLGALSPPSLFQIEDQWSSREERLRIALEKVQQLENLCQKSGISLEAQGYQSESQDQQILLEEKLLQEQQLLQDQQLLQEQQLLKEHLLQEQQLLLAQQTLQESVQMQQAESLMHHSQVVPAIAGVKRGLRGYLDSDSPKQVSASKISQRQMEVKQGAGHGKKTPPP